MPLTIIILFGLILVPPQQGAIHMDGSEYGGLDLSGSLLLSGSLDEEIVDAVVNSNGETYVVGNTQSADFPVINAIESSPNETSSQNSFIVKLTTGQTEIAWSRLISHNDGLFIHRAILDASDNLIILAQTLSFDDIYVAKLNPSGLIIWEVFLQGDYTEVPIDMFRFYDEIIVLIETSSESLSSSSSLFTRFPFNQDADVFVMRIDILGDIVFGEYIGGTDNDHTIGGVVFDNNLYFAGLTQSLDFPILNAFDSQYNSDDGYIVSFDLNIGEIIWSTFYGGQNGDWVRDIDATNDHVVIVGGTSSTDLPTEGSGTQYRASSDGFIAVFDFDGNLVQGRYVGGLAYDDIYSLSTLGNDYYVVGTGYTDETINIGSTLLSDCLVQKYKNGQLDWSKKIGGSSFDVCREIVVDIDGSIYVIGESSSDDFPLSDNPDHLISDEKKDGIIFKLNQHGDLIYGEYIGGSETDEISKVLIDKTNDENELYIFGNTFSNDTMFLEGETYYGESEGFIISMFEYSSPTDGGVTDPIDPPFRSQVIYSLFYLLIIIVIALSLRKYGPILYKKYAPQQPMKKLKTIEKEPLSNRKTRTREVRITELVCGSCGSMNPGDSIFCMECGTTL